MSKSHRRKIEGNQKIGTKSRKCAPQSNPNRTAKDSGRMRWRITHVRENGREKADRSQFRAYAEERRKARAVREEGWRQREEKDEQAAFFVNNAVGLEFEKRTLKTAVNLDAVRLCLVYGTPNWTPSVNPSLWPTWCALAFELKAHKSQSCRAFEEERRAGDPGQERES